MTITTEAAVVESGSAPFTLAEVELDEPRADEVLVRMTAAGLCHTDLGVASGGLPFPLPGVLGHEGAGVVERVGSAVTSVAPGDHVLLSFTSCGGCGNCRGGHPAYCATWLPDNLIGGARRDGSATITRGGEPLGGALLRPVVVRPRWPSPTSAAWSGSTPRSPRARSPRSAAACRPASGRSGTCSGPVPAAPVVVAGAGAVGLTAVMAAALTPAHRIVAVDVVPARLDLAGKLGATHVVDASTEDLPARIAEITGGAGATAHRDHRQRPGAAPGRRQPRRPRHRGRRGRTAVRHRGQARRQRDARRQDRHRHHPRRQRDPDLHPGARRHGRRRPAAGR